VLHRWAQWAAAQWAGSGVTVFEGANKLALIRHVHSACCSLQHVCYMTMHVRSVTCKKSHVTCKKTHVNMQHLFLMTPRPFRALGASTLQGSLACPASQGSLARTTMRSGFVLRPLGAGASPCAAALFLSAASLLLAQGYAGRAISDDKWILLKYG
jgi:hypothetical protein